LRGRFVFPLVPGSIALALGLCMIRMFRMDWEESASVEGFSLLFDTTSDDTTKARPASKQAGHVILYAPFFYSCTYLYLSFQHHFTRCNIFDFASLTDSRKFTRTFSVSFHSAQMNPTFRPL
jgi:hypothetical protein